MIELKEFSLPADDYFRDMLRRVLKAFGWIFAYTFSITGFLWLPRGYVGLWVTFLVLLGCFHVGGGSFTF